MTKIYTDNEWAPLKRVVVGTADHANWPQTDPVFVESMKNSKWKDTEFCFGPVADDIINRANYSLNDLAEVLESLDIEVIRPLPRNYQSLDQFYGYCPRDTVLIVGDRVIATPTKYPSRRNEW